jgi:transposase
MMHARTRWRMAQVAELTSLGLTRRQCAAALKIPATTVSTLARVAGLPKHYDTAGWAETIAKSKERAKAMAALYKAGRTLEQIGQQYGITRERVRQLMTKHCGIRYADGGAHANAKDRKARRAGAKNDESLLKWGCTRAEYIALRDMKKPTRAYAAQRRNAHIRGIGWELTLWQWWTIWQQSGHWAERGIHSGQYVMCRRGDAGPYAVGNVFIALSSENVSSAKKSDLPTGVRRTRGGNRYAALRQINGKKLYLGTFAAPDQAYAAYLTADVANARPPRPRKPSGLPMGVSYTYGRNKKRYRAYYYEDRKQVHVGCFNTVDEAVAALALRALPTPMQRAA